MKINIFSHVLAAGLLFSSQLVLAADRNFDFVMTGDPQYDNGAHSRNDVATRTLKAMGNQVLANPSQVKGVLIAGDLTQNTRPYDEYKFYKSAISSFQQHVYDGQGNHDEHEPDGFVQESGCTFNATWCVDKDYIVNDLRSRNRSTAVNMHSEGGVYSWDWEGVHFIQLGSYAGSRQYSSSWASYVKPYGSLNFLRDDLASRVGPTGKPVVLVMHYTFDSDRGDNSAWSNQQAADMWNALEGYNVVAVMSGHIHYGQGGGWARTSYRPSGATKGPASLPNIVVGAALNGIYVKASVRNDQMTLQRFYVDGSGSAGAIDSAVNINIAKQNMGFAELRDGKANKCLDITGSSPYTRANVLLHGCANVDWQKWAYDVDSKHIINKADTGYCLDQANQAQNGGKVQLWPCENHSDLVFDMDTNRIRSGYNNNYVLDANGTSDGSNVSQYSANGGSHQNWSWGKRDNASAISNLVQGMRANKSYGFKLRAKSNDCSLEWDGGLSNNERNAKFDCSSNGDPVTFVASSNPVQGSDGLYSIDGKIYTNNDSCGLEWDGSLSSGERNAKFDCGGSADPLTLKTTGKGAAEIIITSNNCGLQWAGGSDNERNAKFDCDPAWDEMIISELIEK